MSTISKTAAIKEARKHVSIQGGSTSWTIVHPWDELDGPTTETTAVSYFEAQARARSIKVSLALQLMGKLDEHAEYAIYNYGQGTFDELLAAGLKAYGNN